MHARRWNNREAGAAYIPIRRRLPIYVPNHLVSRLAKQPAVAAAASTSSRQQLATLATSSTYSISSCWFSPFAFSPVLHDLSPPPLISSPLLLSSRVHARARALAPRLLHIVVVEITTTIHQGYLPYRYYHGTVHTVYSSTTPESHRGHSSCIAGNADMRARAHTRTSSTYTISTPRVYMYAKLRLSRSWHTHLRTHTLVHSYRAMHTCNTHACVHKSTTA